MVKLNGGHAVRKINGDALTLQDIELLLQATEMLNHLVRDDDFGRSDYVKKERDRVVANIYLAIDLNCERIF